MTASFRMVAALACTALANPPALQCQQSFPGCRRTGCEPERACNPALAQSYRCRTVYQCQALVTREVNVPEDEGTVELVVTPLPPQTIDQSLHTSIRSSR